MQNKVAAKRTGQASRGRHITQRRSKQERLIDIIRVVAANGPLRRTHILYKANLTWGELREDLDALEKVGAIKMMESGEGTFYGSTEVGLELLNHSSRIVTILTGNASNM
ncbi:MAG: winged helix-turn-helix domain-containing protein [Nitrososphaerales archaeon]